MITTTESTPPPDADTFIIYDNSSEIAKFIPEKYVEPLVIIARIQGLDGIDDYIIQLIKDRLEMFADNSHDNLDDAFQKYMHNMIIGGKKDVPNTRRHVICFSNDFNDIYLEFGSLSSIK